MKKTSVLCAVIILMLLLICMCMSSQKHEPKDDVQNSKGREQKTKSIVASVEGLCLDSDIITEETELNSQSNDFDIDTDYGLLMAQAMANEDYVQAMLYEDIKNQKNEYLGVTDNLNYDDLLLLSKIVDAEAGSSWLTDEHRLLVASVVVNRIHSPEFPDTLHEVVYQKGQYSPVRNERFDELVPSESSVMAAYTILTEGSIAPIDVVYQANFIQGSKIYKEIHDDKLGTTYFCYSKNRNLYK